MEYIISICITVIAGLLLSIIKWLLNENRKLRENEKTKKDTKDNALSDAILCLLRVKLIEYHDKYVQDGHIPAYAYENWSKMFKAYTDLGGNGLVKGLNEEIEQLPII